MKTGSELLENVTADTVNCELEHTGSVNCSDIALDYQGVPNIPVPISAETIATKGMVLSLGETVLGQTAQVSGEDCSNRLGETGYLKKRNQNKHLNKILLIWVWLLNLNVTDEEIKPTSDNLEEVNNNDASLTDVVMSAVEDIIRDEETVVAERHILQDRQITTKILKTKQTQEKKLVTTRQFKMEAVTGFWRETQPSSATHKLKTRKLETRKLVHDCETDSYKQQLEDNYLNMETVSIKLLQHGENVKDIQNKNGEYPTCQNVDGQHTKFRYKNLVPRIQRAKLQLALLVIIWQHIFTLGCDLIENKF